MITCIINNTLYCYSEHIKKSNQNRIPVVNRERTFLVIGTRSSGSCGVYNEINSTTIYAKENNLKYQATYDNNVYIHINQQLYLISCSI